MISVKSVLVCGLLSLGIMVGFSSSVEAFGPPPPGFVGIQGDQFVINGEPIRIKGTNYYPRNGMWANLWNNWNWNAMVTETAMIRDFGMNSVRILVPYSHGGWGSGYPSESRLKMLEDLVNLFGEQGIRSNITLFDWETSYPDPGTQREQDHYNYVTTIVNRLKNNPYVFLWDVKNEPDHPSAISGFDDWNMAPVQRDRIKSWLQRMCNHIRNINPNQPVTVGMRWYNNVPDVLPFVDVACFHSYWPHITNSLEIPTIKNAMGANQKPILAQEFGWPTNPHPCNRDGQIIWDYNENHQLSFYQTIITAFKNHNIAGGLQWMTFDAKNYTTNQNESFENYFGLWRYNYTLKPAAEYYRDNYPTRMFPTIDDTVPPGPVRNFQASALDTAVRLTWTNPSDDKLTGVMIRYKTGGYPTSPTDGNQLFSRPASPNANESYIHSGLTNGVRYYYTAYAYKENDLISSPANTYATPHLALLGQKIGEVKLLPDNTDVNLVRKVVTGVFPSIGATYISEPDRSSAIRVTTIVPGISVGDTVTVTGKMGTRMLGAVKSERMVMNPQVVMIAEPNSPLQPLAIRPQQIGGGPIGNYAVGVRGGTGLNNIGKLVTVSGTVTFTITSYIYIDDGSNVEDISGRVGVMVSCPSSILPVQVGDHVTITGIVSSSVPSGWDTNRRFVLMRNWNDLEVVSAK